MPPNRISTRVRTLGRQPWHPFLLAASPVIAMAAANIEQVRLAEIARPMLVALMAEGIFLGLLGLILTDRHRAALVASGLTLLFVAYGHIYELLESVQLLGEPIGRHRYLVPLGAVAAFGIWWVARRIVEPRRWTGILNLTAGVLIAIPLIQWSAYGLSIWASPMPTTSADAASDSGLHLPERPPDIYYLILDGYAREDVLAEMFAFDNSEFVQALEDRGFFVADLSQSNYAQTDLSIASSLNLEYLQALDGPFGPEDTARSPLRPYIRHSRLTQALRSIGYSIVAFDTGYNVTELRDADVYLNPRRKGLRRWIERGEFTPFESMLVYATGLRVLADSPKLLPDFLVPDVTDPYQKHRERVLFVLSSLIDLAREPGPKFVFVHLLSPHQPFVFGPNGEPIDPPGAFTLASQDGADSEQDSKRGYVGQIQFLNNRLLPVIDALIGQSENPPIIIFQGDHGPPVGGPSAEDRMSILNAYYLPGEPSQRLYPSISPVNTFRLIFREYFGADLPMLDDIAFYSSYKTPYRFTEMEPAGEG